MKTNFIPILCLSMFTYSCSEVNYRMSTVIDRDGRVAREVCAAMDSAYIARDMSKNPFMFFPDETWKMTICDSVSADNPEGRPYVIIRKNAKSIEDFSSGLQYDAYKRSLVAPAESLKKCFRWFYTYYDFKAVYSEITDKGTIPLDSYLSKEEQGLWFQGDLSPYAHPNGVELKAALDEIESKFWNWHHRSMYEIYFDIFLRHAKDGPYITPMHTEKDNIFATNSKSLNAVNFTTEAFCKMLDKYFSTKYFVTLYEGNADDIDSEVEAKTSITNLFENKISYMLNMPGKVIQTNGSLSPSGDLAWEVDAWRVLAADYTLTAQSRAPNYWAWVITLLVIISPILFFVLAGKKRED